MAAHVLIQGDEAMTVPARAPEPGIGPLFPPELPAEPRRSARVAALTMGVALWVASVAAAASTAWFAGTWGPSIGPLFQAAAVLTPLVAGTAALALALVPTFVHVAERRMS